MTAPATSAHPATGQASADFRDPGLVFPPEFVFGTATASYQIEGAVHEGGRRPSIWDTFSHTPGRVRGGDTGDVADDHYHHLEHDLDLLQSYEVDAYRFSIAWPRIQPGGSGPRNREGIDFYNRLIDGLLERGISPTVTLYHWDLPQPLQDAGGWPVRETAYRFADYAAICAEEFGDRVTQWTTLNEPWCSAFLGYAVGVHAPGIQDADQALRAAHHLNLAHGLAVQALRDKAAMTPSVSITCNLYTVLPASESPEDRAAAEKVIDVSNRIFTGPLLHGAYPESLVANTSHLSDWSFVAPGDLEQICQPIEVFGLNWYTPQYVRPAENPLPLQPWQPTTALGCEDVEFVDRDGDRTDMGWLVEPSGLQKMLTDLAQEFPGLPLVITENGAAYDDPVVDGRCHDPRRIDYLQRHITAVHRALSAGAPIVGYYVWSLMDNFEWAEGYAKRFGITHVDYDTLVRTPKDSALWFRKLARTHVIPEVDDIEPLG